jgi:uncharacterized protein
MPNAWTLYETICADSRISFLEEPPEVETAWKRYTSQETRAPKLWNDAWLAAFAFAESLELVSFDKGFRQFDGLKSCILPSG